MKIALFNLWTTIRIYFFLFVVNVRIIINFFVFLLFPIIIISALTYITSKIFLAITITILIIIFLILILILWYLGWVFDVFKTAVRYYAYEEWKKKIKSDWHDNHWGHDDGHWHGWHDDHWHWWHWHDEHHH
jgi:hypothetical protein